MSCMIDGDPNAPILIVGMAPGKDELEADAPFVGASGNLLWSAATRAGFTRADCYILNTIGEIQADKAGPTPAQYNKYWDTFDQALAASKAKVAFLLGGDALWRVMGLKGIQGWRGYLLRPKDGLPLTRETKELIPYKTSAKCKACKGRGEIPNGTDWMVCGICTGDGRGHKKGDLREVSRKVDTTVPLPTSLDWVIPSLHPSNIMRTGWKTTPVIMYDTARVGRAWRGELNIDPPWSGDGLVFDIETAMSLAGDAAIVEIGFAGGFADAWNKNYSESRRWDSLTRDITMQLLGGTYPKIAHNAGFDIPRLEAAGVHIYDPIFCTMFACQMLQPDLPKGLNFVASLYLDTPRWKHLRSAPDYNLLDVRRTRQLYDVVREGLKETGQLQLFTDTVMPALRTYISLTRRGIKVDTAKQNALRQQYSSSISNARDAWERYHPGVNPNSHQQLKQLLYDDLGLPPQKNHKGKVSVDKYCLQRLLKKTDRVDAIQTLIEYKSLVDDAEYIEVPYDHLHVIHPSYVPAGKDDKDEEEESKRGIAGTGRPQAHDPNIMQVPKAIRSMYIPHHPGWRLVEFDFNQAELRVAAAVSGDTGLARALDGPDLHQVNATRWGCSRPEAKTVAYGVNYGMGAWKLKTLFPSRSLAECEHIINSVYASYPGLLNYKNKIISQIQANRYLVNPFGRRRYFWNPKGDVPKALDFVPQSTVADIVWASVKELNEIAHRFGGHLLTTIHDSFLFEFPDPLVAVQAIQTYLTREFPNVAPGFHLPVTYKVGDNWGEVYEVDEEHSEEPVGTDG